MSISEVKNLLLNYQYYKVLLLALESSDEPVPDDYFLVDFYKANLDYIYSLIVSIDDPLIQAIFRYKYIQCLTWEQVADITFCSLRTVYYLHNKGLVFLSNKIQKIPYIK